MNFHIQQKFQRRIFLVNCHHNQRYVLKKNQRVEKRRCLTTVLKTLKYTLFYDNTIRVKCIVKYLFNSRIQINISHLECR